MEQEDAAEAGMSNEDARAAEGPDLVLEYKIIGKLNFVTAATHSKRLRKILLPSITVLVNLQQVTESCRSEKCWATHSQVPRNSVCKYFNFAEPRKNKLHP